MSQVVVTINGRNFRMACDDGQEEHLSHLAAQVDEKINGLRASFGEIGDVRLTVMTAIMIMDDLSEMRRKVKTLERDLDALKEARVASIARLDTTQQHVAKTLNLAAERIERISSSLVAGSFAAGG
jgi:cell division protein ZapA